MSEFTMKLFYATLILKRDSDINMLNLPIIKCFRFNIKWAWKNIFIQPSIDRDDNIKWVKIQHNITLLIFTCWILCSPPDSPLETQCWRARECCLRTWGQSPCLQSQTFQSFPPLMRIWWVMRKWFCSFHSLDDVQDWSEPWRLWHADQV